MADMVQREELASFLRSRREATDPVSVGLRPGSRRRTPGLRREELAQLSGISVTWYTWLEQGRHISVSRQVIESLARVLRMTSAEREHLFTVAGLALPVQTAGPPEVDDTLRRLVQALDPNPALVVNPWWDLLAYNQVYSALHGGLDGLPPAERNVLWLFFTATPARYLIVNWLDEGRQLVGQLRAHLAQHPGDPRGPELVATLTAASPTFAELWPEHTTARFRSYRKGYQHPTAGLLSLDYIKLAAASNDRQDLIVMLPADQTTADKLRQLLARNAGQQVPVPHHDGEGADVVLVRRTAEVLRYGGARLRVQVAARAVQHDEVGLLSGRVVPRGLGQP
jgi:transcriptional regulator with XRE-family HTH domain